MKYILKNWVVTIFILSIVAISSAFVAENFLDMAPCKLCLKQRHPYYVIIFVVFLFYFLKKHKDIWLFIITELAAAYGLFYAIWHTGIEQKILPGPSSCSGALKKIDSVENLKDQIINQSIVSCSNISWSIFGLSAATINSFVLLFILVFNTIYIYKHYYD
jgi:disulfide bond formation protein DsbB